MSDAANKPNQKVGSVFDLPSKSFEIVKNNWQMFAFVNILSILSALAALFGNNGVNKENGYDATGISSGQELAGVLGVGAIFLVIFIAVSIFLYAMRINLEIKSAQGKKPDLKALIESGKKYWLRLLGLIIVMALIIGAGLILLIVPGIIAIGRLVFAPYRMVDQDLSITESLKASNEMSKNNVGLTWAAIGLFVAISIGAGLISSISHIGPLLSTLISIAFSLILVLRYFEIKGPAHHKLRPHKKSNKV